MNVFEIHGLFVFIDRIFLPVLIFNNKPALHYGQIYDNLALCYLIVIISDNNHGRCGYNLFQFECETNIREL